jgi:DNA-binding ferritin-like protein (Dps family)
MAARWIELITGSLEAKKRWRAYKARVQQLPPSYRTAVEGVERYLMYTGPGDGGQLIQMVDDLADLFERAAADGTPVRTIVGDDPVEFAEAFKNNYGLGSWLSKEQRRLTDAIERAENEEGAR